MGPRDKSPRVTYFGGSYPNPDHATDAALQ